MSRPIKDPIPVAPFLRWCEEREEQIRRELDRYPAIRDRRGRSSSATATPPGVAPRTRLVLELGWGHEVDTAIRRLHRWATPGYLVDGMVERATVEDALDHAGADFGALYPDLPEKRLWPSRLGMGRLMTDEQVIAAHVVYVKGRMTMESLSELIWTQFGYASAESCAEALWRSFRGLGLAVRQCSARTLVGDRCERQPLSGSDLCSWHVSKRGYTLPCELVDQARHLYAGGLTMKEVSRQLLPLTPLSSDQWLAERLSVAGLEQGWYRPTPRRRSRLGVAA